MTRNFAKMRPLQPFYPASGRPISAAHATFDRPVRVANRGSRHTLHGEVDHGCIAGKTPTAVAVVSRESANYWDGLIRVR